MTTVDVRPEALLARVAALTVDQRRLLGQMIDGEEGATDRRALTAYIALRTPDVDEVALKDFLSTTLPEHMVPTRFVVVDRLPRTASGKLDRRAVVHAPGTELGSRTSGVVAPRNETEATLVRIWREVLNVDEISVHDDFFEIGGDSLLSIRAISRAGREGIRITPQSFFEAPTIARLAALEAAPEVSAEQGEVVGQAPLAPIHHWFFERITRQRHHWNQAVLLRPPRDADPEAIRRALRVLITHHDALRTRFVRVDGNWRQEFPPVEDVPFRTVDLAGMSGPERELGIEAEADAEQASLDLGEGRLFRAVHFDGGPDFTRLLLVAHHLVIDAESWGIVLEDLSNLVARGDGTSGRDLPRKTTSALAWAEALAKAARGPDVARLASLWTDMPAPGTVPGPGVSDPPPAADGAPSSAGAFRVELDEAGTVDLKEQAAGPHGTSLQELVLASVLLSWCRWSGRSGLRLDVEGHGRDVLSGEFDVSRTVGWFTTVFPVSIRLSEASAESCILAVREAFLRLPMRGASHGLLRYLGDDPQCRGALANQPRSELLFNFLGTGHRSLPPDSPFEWAAEATGNARPADTPQAYPVEINAWVEGGRLVLDVAFDRAIHGDPGMRGLGAALRVALLEVGQRQVDPSLAFDLSELDEGGLQRVSDLLTEIDQE